MKTISMEFGPLVMDMPLVPNIKQYRSNFPFFYSQLETVYEYSGQRLARYNCFKREEIIHLDTIQYVICLQAVY